MSLGHLFAPTLLTKHERWLNDKANQTCENNLCNKETLMLCVNGYLSDSCYLAFLNVYTLLSIDHLNHSNSYLMESFHFENVEYAKDLGITIDSHLKFHQHYSLVISKYKANRILDIFASF